MGRRARGVLGAAVPFLVVAAGSIGVVTPAPAGAAISDAYSEAVSAAGPSVYLRLGDTASPAVDEAGAAPGTLNGGVLTGTPGALADSTDTAMTFDGVNDHVALGGSSALRPNLFTVQTWFRASTPRTASAVLARWRTFGWSLTLQPGGVSASVYDVSGVEHFASWADPFSDGAWHHVAGVRGDTTLTLYVDGIERASVAVPPVTRYGTGGAGLARDGDANGRFFAGDLDEFALFPTPLSPEQIATQYCASGVASPLCNRAPVAVAADQVVEEGSTVVLDGSASTDEDGDPLTYAWELLSSTGPAIDLTGEDTAQASFVALDDGEYRFRLTADDGEETAETEATVTVVNAPPVVTLVPQPTDAPGTVAVQATVTDPGPLDTMSATYDFGDGDPAGAAATHRYARAGRYTVTAFATDDDGASASSAIDVDVAPRVPSAALFGASDAPWALGLHLHDVDVTGRVHSNGGFLLVGNGSRVTGGVESVLRGAVIARRTVVDPPPVLTGPEAGPWVGIDEYRPGAPGAQAAGDGYHDMSASCSRKQGWRPRGALAPGLYYAACNVDLGGAHLAGPVTIAAEGRVALDVRDGATLTPYVDGVLVVSGASDVAVLLRAKGARLDGAVVAWDGAVVAAAKDTTFGCGLAGATVLVDARSSTFVAPTCG